MKVFKDPRSCCRSKHTGVTCLLTTAIFLCGLSTAGLTTVVVGETGGRRPSLGGSVFGGTSTAPAPTTTGTAAPAAAASLPTPKIESLKPNTTAFVGQTAYLQCIVKHLGDKTVSWIRRRDLHILTSGNHVYTSDPRVSLLRQGKPHDMWTLKILQVRKKDEGQYECQVNTEPKSTYTFSLVIVGTVPSEETEMKAAGWRLPESPPLLYQHDSIANPKLKVTEARILGAGRVEIDEGSIANFTCIISHPGLAAPNVTWFYNDIPVKQSSAIQGGINIETEKSLFSTVSKLVIVRVDPRNQGKYSCGGPAIYPASVVLRIFSNHSGHGDVNELVSAVSTASSSGLRDKGGGTWSALVMILYLGSQHPSMTLPITIPFFIADLRPHIKILHRTLKEL